MTDRKRALILYSHGLGDVIILTPHLRQLWKDGYIVDLMCREQVVTSHLLDDCPYVDELFVVPNPHKAKNFSLQKIENELALDEQAEQKDYDYVGKALHVGWQKGLHKIDINSQELGFKPDNEHLEIFVHEDIQKEVTKWLHSEHPYCPWHGYVFRHTAIKEHDWHTWDATEYIKEHFKLQDVYNTGYDGEYYMWKENINYTFALINGATGVILSSSVMVHACEAMDKEIGMETRPFCETRQLVAVQPGDRRLGQALFMCGVTSQPTHPFRPGVRRIAQHAIE